MISLESFEGDIPIAEIEELDFIEIVLTGIDGEILAPVIREALHANRIPHLDIGNFINSRTKRYFESCFGDIARSSVRVLACPPVLWKYGKLAHNMRQLAVAFLREDEGHLVVARLLCLGNILVVEGVLRTDLLEGRHAPDNVVGRYGLAVMEPRFGPQAIDDLGKVVRIPDLIGDEPIHGARLIEGGRHKCLGRNSAIGRGLALEGERVEAVI